MINKELFNELFYKVDLQFFSDDDSDLEEKEKEDDDDNLDGDEYLDDNDDSKEKDKKITLTSKQLNQRLKRERNNVLKKFETSMATMINEALLKHDEEKAKKEKEAEDFASMTKAQREEALQKKRDDELKQIKKELEDQKRQNELAKAKEAIVNQYNEDKLPYMDIFNKDIAPFIATLSEDKKVVVYEGIKTILQKQKSEILRNSLKQRPPKDGSGSNSNFVSDKFVTKNKKDNPSQKDRWGF